MEFLQIRSDAVKVMLSAEETVAFGFSAAALKGDRAHFADAVREILSLAGDKCTIGRGRLLVQVYTSRIGDSEIFVRELPCGSITQSQSYRTADAHVSGASFEHRRYIYSFDGITPMLHACNRLRFAGYSGDSAAYKDEERRRYYLVLETRTPLPEEHGGTLCPRTVAYYISEHCFLICTGAVELLGALA